MLLQDNSIPVPVDLAVKLSTCLKTRASDGAVFVQQLHYWIAKGQGKLINGVRWIYNTYTAWRSQLPWLTEWDFRQIVFKLRELGLVNFSQPSDHGRDRTGYYTLNYSHEYLKNLVSKSSDGGEDLGSPPSEDCPRHTESTPQSSSKNTSLPTPSQEKTKREKNQENQDLEEPGVQARSPDTPHSQPKLDGDEPMDKSKDQRSEPLPENENQNRVEVERSPQGEDRSTRSETARMRGLPPQATAANPEGEDPVRSPLTLHPAQLMEQRLRRGGELDIHRTGRGPNSIDPSFVEFVRQEMERKFKERKEAEDAIGWIANREFGGRDYQSHGGQLVAMAQRWQQKMLSTGTPSEGEILAKELDIIENNPVLPDDDRFSKQDGKYRWEREPGSPVERLLQWCADQISKTKRPEWAGKSPSVLAWEDLQKPHIAAIAYEDWKKYARSRIGNYDTQLATLRPSEVPASETTVEAEVKPPEENPLQSKISRLQGKLNSEYPYLVKLAKDEIEADPEVELVDGIVEVAF